MKHRLRKKENYLAAENDATSFNEKTHLSRPILKLQTQIRQYSFELFAGEFHCPMLNKVFTESRRALLKLEHYQKTADELSIQLKSTEMERDMFIDECREARAQIGEFNSKMKEMADQLLDAVNTREQLADVLSELKATQGELLSIETELAVARDSNIKAVTQAELMQNTANMEKEKTQELLRRILELREAIAKLSLAAAEAEKENLALLSEKDAEIESATEAAVQAQSKLKGREQVEMTEEVERQIMTKSAFIDRLQLELKQANELLSSAEKSASDAIW